MPFLYSHTMQKQSVNQLFPFWKLVLLLAFMSLASQLLIILYNHYSGYYQLDHASDFFIRWVFSSILTLAASFLLAYPDLWMINILNSHWPWQQHAFMRLLVELPLLVLWATGAALIITFFSHTISAYTEPLSKVIINNILIAALINLILVIVLEAWLFFIEGSKARRKAEQLENELAQVQFQVLKSQMNPHFLFNSLNVLSGLIGQDDEKAQDFIMEFSLIYRYVLETIEKKQVTLKEEIDFVHAYFFLQQIRYGESLKVHLQIPSDYQAWLLPPLSLQTVLENAMKHNVAEPQHPLEIAIFIERQQIVVQNNLQKKVSVKASTGLGQKNLKKRYALLGDIQPTFYITQHHYRAVLPLYNPAHDESSNY